MGKKTPRGSAAGTVIAIAVVAWHIYAIVKDVERYKVNLQQARANPSVPNLARLAVAAGILIADL
ncbi:MAG: hypothetical protein V7603_1566 [Micromonosporaceae bacterium]